MNDIETELIASVKMKKWLKRKKAARIVYWRIREVYGYAKLSMRISPWPKSKFLIFAQGRSGSTLLRSLIGSHPEIQCDDEILRFRMMFPLKHIHAQAALSRRQVYGFKVKIYQLTDHQGITDPRSFLFTLHQAGWKILYLKRTNLLKQALSNIVANLRQEYHYKATDKKIAIDKIIVDCNEVLARIKQREHYLKQESDVLKDLPYFTAVRVII